LGNSVLVTGGAGYIGSHVLYALAMIGRRCVSIDNYSNSSPLAIERVASLVGAPITAYHADIRDQDAIRRIATDHPFDSVIHLAGLKSVAESMAKPKLYRDNNVLGTQAMLEALEGTGLRNFVFSSSACVYAISETQPLNESAALGPYNAYGENKLEIERILVAWAARGAHRRVANLRYFNPVGAHPSGSIGEDPTGVPNNLMPYVCQVAAGTRAQLNIFGNDYPTVDGTGVRDYIHVMDLAEGHVAALESLERSAAGTVLTVNLGTGQGVSVLQLVEAFERANGVKIPRQFVARRAGDIARYFADPAYAGKVMAWKAKRGIEDMVRDAWNWQRRNPKGYNAT
jgi:UDP-glucose 4-epimerase